MSSAYHSSREQVVMGDGQPSVRRPITAQDVSAYAGYIRSARSFTSFRKEPRPRSPTPPHCKGASP